MVLLALVNADYKIIRYDITTVGTSFDCQIFKYSYLRRKILDGTTGFASAELLLDAGPKTPARNV